MFFMCVFWAEKLINSVSWKDHSLTMESSMNNNFFLNVFFHIFNFHISPAFFQTSSSLFNSGKVSPQGVQTEKRPIIIQKKLNILTSTKCVHSCVRFQKYSKRSWKVWKVWRFLKKCETSWKLSKRVWNANF